MSAKKKAAVWNQGREGLIAALRTLWLIVLGGLVLRILKPTAEHLWAIINHQKQRSQGS